MSEPRVRAVCISTEVRAKHTDRKPPAWVAPCFSRISLILPFSLSNQSHTAPLPNRNVKNHKKLESNRQESEEKALLVCLWLRMLQLRCLTSICVHAPSDDKFAVPAPTVLNEHARKSMPVEPCFSHRDSPFSFLGILSESYVKGFPLLPTAASAA